VIKENADGKNFEGTTDDLPKPNILSTRKLIDLAYLGIPRLFEMYYVSRPRYISFKMVFKVSKCFRDRSFIKINLLSNDDHSYHGTLGSVVTAVPLGFWSGLHTRRWVFRREQRQSLNLLSRTFTTLGRNIYRQQATAGVVGMACSNPALLTRISL
jgi:hypothetical protein